MLVIMYDSAIKLDVFMLIDMISLQNSINIFQEGFDLLSVYEAYTMMKYPKLTIIVRLPKTMIVMRELWHF